MTRVTIHQPRCVYWRLYVDGRGQEWGIDVAAADDETNEVTALLRDPRGQLLYCTPSACNEYCDGEFEHFPVRPDDPWEWVCVQTDKHFDMRLTSWPMLSDEEKFKQARAQGYLDGSAGKTNWGRAYFGQAVAQSLLDEYDEGYTQGHREWRRRYPYG